MCRNRQLHQGCGIAQALRRFVQVAQGVRQKSPQRQAIQRVLRALTGSRRIKTGIRDKSGQPEQQAGKPGFIRARVGDFLRQHAAQDGAAYGKPPGCILIGMCWPGQEFGCRRCRNAFQRAGIEILQEIGVGEGAQRRACMRLGEKFQYSQCKSGINQQQVSGLRFSFLASAQIAQQMRQHAGMAQEWRRPSLAGFGLQCIGVGGTWHGGCRG